MKEAGIIILEITPKSYQPAIQIFHATFKFCHYFWKTMSGTEVNDKYGTFEMSHPHMKVIDQFCND